MIVSGDTSVMLLVEPFFEGFIARRRSQTPPGAER